MQPAAPRWKKSFSDTLPQVDRTDAAVRSLIASTRLSFKVHRFEFATALLVASGLLLWGVLIALRSDSSGLSQSCIDEWARVGSEASSGCAQTIRAWGTTIVSESPGFIAALLYLPFAVGLLAGVPIVGRELETGTARTAWSLYPSRLLWLARQTLPILAAVTVLSIALALVSSSVESGRSIWGYSPLEDQGRYGVVLVANTIAAFAIALAVGALLGRTLPALVLSTMLAIALVGASAQFHDAWLRTLPTEVISEGSGQTARDLSPGAIATGSAWRSPDGGLISPEEATAIAHGSGVSEPDSGDLADSAALEWLEGHGYVAVSLGIPKATALSWEVWETTGKLVIAIAFGGLAVYSVRRRRPT